MSAPGTSKGTRPVSPCSELGPRVAGPRLRLESGPRTGPKHARPGEAPKRNAYLLQTDLGRDKGQRDAVHGDNLREPPALWE